MTKKDYQRIADAISDGTRDAFRFTATGSEAADGMREMRSAIIHRLVRTLSEDNPRFDPERFRAACLVRFSDSEGAL